MKSYPLKPLWFSLIYLVLVAYLYSFSEYGLNVWDEGGYANGTLRTLNGEKAMEDFNPSGYLSGRYIYGAIFFKLFGVSIQSLRIGVILITPVMIFMTLRYFPTNHATGFCFSYSSVRAFSAGNVLQSVFYFLLYS